MLLLKCIRRTCHFPSGFTIENELSRKCLTSKSLFHFICILDFPHFCYPISFSSYSFSTFSCKHYFFCWSSKTPWDRAGGFLLFKVPFLPYLFLKNNRPRNFFQFYSLKSSYVPVMEAQGLAESILSCTPYSVREWCRFLTKLSRLLSKSDCFQPVSFDTPCNPPFRCRGVSIISFACVMTDSSTLKNSQTAAEGCQLSALLV